MDAIKLMSISDHTYRYTGPYYGIDIAFTNICRFKGGTQHILI